MILLKNEKKFIVEESVQKWIVAFENGKLSLSYDIPKSLCATYEDLKKYILLNDLF